MPQSITSLNDAVNLKDDINSTSWRAAPPTLFSLSPIASLSIFASGKKQQLKYLESHAFKIDLIRNHISLCGTNFEQILISATTNSTLTSYAYIPCYIVAQDNQFW